MFDVYRNSLSEYSCFLLPFESEQRVELVANDSGRIARNLDDFGTLWAPNQLMAVEAMVRQAAVGQSGLPRAAPGQASMRRGATASKLKRSGADVAALPGASASHRAVVPLDRARAPGHSARDRRMAFSCRYCDRHGSIPAHVGHGLPTSGFRRTGAFRSHSKQPNLPNATTDVRRAILAPGIVSSKDFARSFPSTGPYSKSVTAFYLREK